MPKTPFILPHRGQVKRMKIVEKKEGKKERYLAYCPTCNAIFDAVSTRREGKYYVSTFIHPHPLVFIKFTLSNSCVTYEGEIPEDVKKIVNYLWIWQGKSDMEILDIVNNREKFLETLREIESLEKATPPPATREPNVKLLIKTQRTSLLNIAVKRINNMNLQDCRDVRLLDAVIKALSDLPQHFKVPEAYANCDYSIPRYYVISAYYDADKNEVEIIDVYNWDKKRGQPGKWSYRSGYWAPLISREIAKTLKLYIRSYT
jgi:hypothetical protein